MKHLAWIGIALLLTLPAAAQELGGNLSDDDRAQLVEMLESSRSTTEELAAQADCAIWSEQPAEDSWSVGEVLEHVVIAEEGIFALALRALEAPEDAEWQSLAGADVAAMVAGMQDRSQKFKAPEQFQPKGEMEREELLRQYGAVRAVTLDYVRSTQAPLKRHTAEGPPGKMNVHQWLVLIAGHNMRHNAQIAEVLEQVGDC